MSEETIYDVVVVGGASAAQSSAIYAKRAGRSVLVVANDYGGQINNTDVVENYLGFKSISGPELAEQYLEHMREYDIDEKTGYRVTDIRKPEDIFEIEREDGEIYRGRSVIIATGGHRRKLGVEGEEEFANKGVGYCAVCDGPLYQGEEVAVIGGGYAGTEAADYLSDIADKVYVLSRSGKLKGEQITIEKVEKEDNVEVIRGAEATKFYGENLLEGLKYEQDDEIKDLEVTGAFIEIGTVPNSDITNLVERDESRRIKVDDDMNAGSEGLYAAGDVNNAGVQQLQVSAGQGCQAGLNASEYVKQSKE